MARPGLRKHPKFLRLVAMIGEPQAHVLGHLECMWETAYECGDPSIGDALDVELVAGWDGASGALCKAMLECGGTGRAGFIEECREAPGRYEVHDLYDHCPEYVRKRMDREAARRAVGKTLSEVRAEAARKRWDKPEQTDANGSHLQPDAMQTDASGCKRHANGTPPAPAPAPAPAPNDKSTHAPAGAGQTLGALAELIVGWNALPEGMVKRGNGANADPPADAVLTGWRSAQQNRECKWRPVSEPLWRPKVSHHPFTRGIANWLADDEVFVRCQHEGYPTLFSVSPFRVSHRWPPHWPNF
jgi:hypothetical protein